VLTAGRQMARGRRPEGTVDEEQRQLARYLHIINGRSYRFELRWHGIQGERGLSESVFPSLWLQCWAHRRADSWEMGRTAGWDRDWLGLVRRKGGVPRSGMPPSNDPCLGLLGGC